MTRNDTATEIKAQAVIDAILAGLRAGTADDDWDAEAMELARELTYDAGSVWDFAGWRDTASNLGYLRIVDEDRPAKLGGVLYAR